MAAILALGACGGEDGGTDGQASVDREADDLSMFPDEVHELLEGLPEPVIQMLADTRAAGPGELVWKDAGGALHDAFNEAYLEEWQAITGWELVTNSPSPSPGEQRVQVDSAQPAWDVNEIGNIAAATVMSEEDLLEPFPEALKNHLEDVFPEGYLVTDDFVQYSALSHPIVWNTDVWPEDGEHPSTPEDLFDTETFPGVRCLYGRPEVSPGTLEYALMADGVAFEDLYPLDIERALEKLDTIRDQTVFWMSGAESIQFILDGNCDLGWSWNGRVAEALDSDPDAPLGYSVDNVLLSAAYLATPNGATNAAAASSALAYAFTAQNQCEVLNAVGYGVPIDESCLEEFGQRAAVTEEVVQQAAGLVDNSEQDLEVVVEEFSAWLAQ